MLVVQIFTPLMNQCYQELPEFSRRLGADGKVIEIFAVQQGKVPGELWGEYDADW